MKLNWDGRKGDGYEWRLGGQGMCVRGGGRGRDRGLRLRKQEWEKKERERGKRDI